MVKIDFHSAKMLSRKVIPPLTSAPAQALELAGKIVQAHAAIYLLVVASDAPRLDELEAASARASAWLAEYVDEVRCLLGDDPYRPQLLRLMTILYKSQHLTSHMCGFQGAADRFSNRRVFAAIDEASGTLHEVRSGTTFEMSVLAGSCVAESRTSIKEGVK